jgi:SOS-response transcriptional repressor LexA
MTEYIGGRNPEVENVLRSGDAVWINKAQSRGFKGVPEDVWNFRIGAYQVCEKWLKDRKGRTLTKDDIAHYHKIIVALSETIRLMKQIDEVIEQYDGWPGAFQTEDSEARTAKVLSFHPRTVDPKPGQRYVTCVPLVPLKAAAGAFSDAQHIADDGFEWVEAGTKHRIRNGMFVAQVVGRSMEPLIPDGSYCLFRAPVEGTRAGKIVLVQLRDVDDPETRQRYTVKKYESQKAVTGDSWRHERITLRPVNPEFDPIVLTGTDEDEVQVIAEFLEVLSADA